MKSADKLAIFTLILGLVLGGGAVWLLVDTPATPAATPTETSDVPTGFRLVSLGTSGMEFVVRETDQVAKLDHNDQTIGYKVVDSFAQSTGAYVDIVTERVEEFYDLPAATDLAAYRENVAGLSIQKTIDVSMNGFTGVKQLYSASIGQKRGDGAIIKQPVNNLMRYVLLASDGRIVIIKSVATFQTYLDAFVKNFHFTAIGSTATTDDAINLDSPDDGTLTPGATNDQLFDTSGAESDQGFSLQ